MAIQKQIWVSDIEANLFKDNEFIRRSKNDDAYVENAVVNLQTAGTIPTVVRTRTTLPATISQRTDVSTDYPIVEFTSSPTLIRNVDETETSYDKRANVLEEHVNTLRDKVGDYVPFTWCPTGAAIATNIIPTTGGNRTLGAAPGATGTRKKFRKNEILEARRIMDRMNVPKNGRVILLPADFYADLLEDSEVLTSLNMNQGNLPEGTVARLYGFDIMVRSSVASATVTTNVVKDPDAATAATDNAMALAWHPSCVRFALGGVDVFADEDKPEYYGSIFSALVRAGSTKARSDQRGVVGIVEVA